MVRVSSACCKSGVWLSILDASNGADRVTDAVDVICKDLADVTVAVVVN